MRVVVCWRNTVVLQMHLHPSMILVWRWILVVPKESLIMTQTSNQRSHSKMLLLPMPFAMSFLIHESYFLTGI